MQGLPPFLHILTLKLHHLQRRNFTTASNPNPLLQPHNTLLHMSHIAHTSDNFTHKKLPATAPKPKYSNRRTVFRLCLKRWLGRVNLHCFADIFVLGRSVGWVHVKGFFAVKVMWATGIGPFRGPFIHPIRGCVRFHSSHTWSSWSPCCSCAVEPGGSLARIAVFERESCRHGGAQQGDGGRSAGSRFVGSRCVAFGCSWGLLGRYSGVRVVGSAVRFRRWWIVLSFGFLSFLSSEVWSFGWRDLDWLWKFEVGFEGFRFNLDLSYATLSVEITERWWGILKLWMFFVVTAH